VLLQLLPVKTSCGPVAEVSRVPEG